MLLLKIKAIIYKYLYALRFESALNNWNAWTDTMYWGGLEALDFHGLIEDQGDWHNNKVNLVKFLDKGRGQGPTRIAPGVY